MYKGESFERVPTLTAFFLGMHWNSWETSATSSDRYGNTFSLSLKREKMSRTGLRFHVLIYVQEASYPD